MQKSEYQLYAEKISRFFKAGENLHITAKGRGFVVTFGVPNYDYPADIDHRRIEEREIVCPGTRELIETVINHLTYTQEINAEEEKQKTAAQVPVLTEKVAQLVDEVNELVSMQDQLGEDRKPDPEQIGDKDPCTYGDESCPEPDTGEVSPLGRLDLGRRGKDSTG